MNNVVGNKQVLGFIDNFYNSFRGNQEHLRSLFRSGYCWHFAHVLKSTFNRGEVCWTAPFGHFVWLDIDNIPYDIEGIYFGDAEYFVPEKYLGDTIKDFQHIPGEGFNAQLIDLEKILNDYLFPKKIKLKVDETGCIYILK